MIVDFYEDAVVLPVRSNWKSEVNVQWSFKTDVFTSRDGSEQRRALREKPRYRMEFFVSETEARARSLRTVAASSIRDKMVFVDFLRAIQFGIIFSGYNVAMSVIPYWIRGGRPLAFMQGSEFTIVKVLSIADGVLSIDRFITTDAYTKIAPVVTGRFPSDMQFSKLTSRVVTTGLDFEEDPTTSLNPIDPLAEEDIDLFYREIPVLPVVPNWSSSVSETFQRNVDVLDFSFGAVDVYAPNKDAVWSSKMTCFARNAQQVRAVEDFFFRRKGQRDAFYCPSWSEDIKILSGAELGSRSVLCEGTDVYDLFFDSNTYRNISIAIDGGAVLAGVINAVKEGVNTRLSLDVALPETVTGKDKASWLMMVRFASDILGISWRTNEVAEFEINVVSVYDRFFELSINEDRIMFNGYYVVMPPRIEKAAFVSMMFSDNHLLVSEDYLG